MARTIDEIADEIKADFMASPTLVELYELDASKPFDQQMPRIGLEALLIQVVAVAIWTVDKVADAFRLETDSRIATQQLMSLKWYWLQALAFQKGSQLRLDEVTYRYDYPQLDPQAQVVKYAAVSDITEGDLPGIRIKVATATKEALTAEELSLFTTYMTKVAAAGTRMVISSEDALSVFPRMVIYYDPLTIDSTGKRIAGDHYPVNDTITAYLDSLDYGGLFSAMALIDRLQMTPGVVEAQFLDLLTADAQPIAQAGAVRITSPTGAFRFGGATHIIYKV